MKQLGFKLWMKHSDFPGGAANPQAWEAPEVEFLCAGARRVGLGGLLLGIYDQTQIRRPRGGALGFGAPLGPARPGPAAEGTAVPNSALGVGRPSRAQTRPGAGREASAKGFGFRWAASRRVGLGGARSGVSVSGRA